MGNESNSPDDRALIQQNIQNIYNAPEVGSEEELLHKSDTSSLSAHNEQYTKLLKAYVEDFKYNAANKRRNKEELFKIAKGLLLWIPVSTVLFMFVIVICIANDWISVLESLPALFSAITTLLGTFMIIPQMITKYLFNKKEEEHLAEIIGKIQEYDRDIRNDYNNVS